MKSFVVILKKVNLQEEILRVKERKEWWKEWEDYDKLKEIKRDKHELNNM